MERYITNYITPPQAFELLISCIDLLVFNTKSKAFLKMAPRPKIELSYLHFTFAENNDKNNELVEIRMRHDKPKLSSFVSTRRDWMQCIFADELARIPTISNYTFSEWRFVSNNPELFEVCGIRFDKVLIVLGEETVYWSFYMNQRNQYHVEGEAQIPLSYCPCCLQQKYLEISKAVRDWIRDNKVQPRILQHIHRPATRLLQLLAAAVS